MTDRKRRVTRHRHMGEGGFTLIELLVVIAILSVLATIVVLNVTGVKSKGNTAACVTDVATVQTAVDEYVNAQASGGLGVFSSTGTSPSAITGGEQTALAPTCVQTAPTSCSSSSTPWGNIDVALVGGAIQVSGAYS